jgi:hypothetical protein
MQVLVKCWVPEHYDFVTHAVLDLDEVMIQKLLAKLDAAEKMGRDYAEWAFRGFVYDDCTPDWIDACPETVGLTDDEFETCDDGSFFIFPAEKEKRWDETEAASGMRPVTMYVMAACGDRRGGAVHWQGYDKHGGAESRCETYRLHRDDLQEILDEIHRRS